VTVTHRIPLLFQAGILHVPYYGRSSVKSTAKARKFRPDLEGPPVKIGQGGYVTDDAYSR
jgi:hypothetical protein